MVWTRLENGQLQYSSSGNTVGTAITSTCGPMQLPGCGMN